MEFSHDPHCDGKHPARQRCNDALAPAGAERRFELPWRAAASNGAASHDDDPAPPEEPAFDPQREAVATVEPPRPTAYAAQAWQSTVAALEAPAHAASDRDHAVEMAAKRGGPLLARAALLAGAVVLALLLWSLARPRRTEAPGGA